MLIHKSFEELSQYYVPKIESVIGDHYACLKDKINTDTKNHWLSEFYDDIVEFCLRPGKRIRPLLFVLGYESYQHQSCGSISESEIIKAASVFEIMHSFLLVHDDIIDKASTRRGKDSMHIILKKRYSSVSQNPQIGEDIAMIVGDMMFFNCLEIVSNLRFPPQLLLKFVREFARTYDYTCRGQLLDIMHSHPYEIFEDVDIPLEISRCKTSYYTINKPLQLGALVAGADESLLNLLEEFSMPLGLCFQIRDDLLGVFSNDVELGKSASSDIIEGKNTLLIQETLKRLSAEEKSVFVDIFLSFEKRQNSVEKIKSMIQNCGAKSYCEDKMCTLAENSRNRLTNVSADDNCKTVLYEIVNKICDLQY